MIGLFVRGDDDIITGDIGGGGVEAGEATTPAWGTSKSLEEDSVRVPIPKAFPAVASRAIFTSSRAAGDWEAEREPYKLTDPVGLVSAEGAIAPPANGSPLSFRLEKFSTPSARFTPKAERPATKAGSSKAFVASSSGATAEARGAEDGSLL